MKTRILVRTEPLDKDWIGAAYGGRGGALVATMAPSEEDLIAQLRDALEDFLATDGTEWLTAMSHAGSPDVPNCPEGAIKRPVDTWICRVTKETCPIQAQVFLNDPPAFFAGCLLDQRRKEGIFRAISQGEYRGFHHLRGRYLCPRCEELHSNQSAKSYHYAWELSSLTSFTPFDLDRDMRDAIPKLASMGTRRSSVLNALCAKHAIEIAALLLPEVAEGLRVLELEIWRPTV